MFIEFVTILLLLLYVLVFWLRGMWDLNSPTQDGTRTPCAGRQSLNHWTTREVPGKGFLLLKRHQQGRNSYFSALDGRVWCLEWPYPSCHHKGASLGYKDRRLQRKKEPGSLRAVFSCWINQALILLFLGKLRSHFSQRSFALNCTVTCGWKLHKPIQRTIHVSWSWFGFWVFLANISYFLVQ